jgi:hypothetical protein
MVNVNVSVLVSEDEDNCNVSEDEENIVNNKNKQQYLSPEIVRRSVIQEENEEDIDLSEYKKPQINIYNININHEREKVVSDKSI